MKFLENLGVFHLILFICAKRCFYNELTFSILVQKQVSCDQHWEIIRLSRKETVRGKILDKLADFAMLIKQQSSSNSLYSQPKSLRKQKPNTKFTEHFNSRVLLSLINSAKTGTRFCFRQNNS